MHCSNLAADALHDAIKNWRAGIHLAPMQAEEAEVPAAGTCDVPGLNEIEHADDYVGKGVYKQVDEVGELEGKRVLVLDKGRRTAKLALELTKVTPRVVFLTELDTLGLPDDLVHEIKRSDVKVLYKSRLRLRGRRRRGRAGARPRPGRGQRVRPVRGRGRAAGDVNAWGRGGCQVRRRGRADSMGLARGQRAGVRWPSRS